MAKLIFKKNEKAIEAKMLTFVVWGKALWRKKKINYVEIFNDIWEFIN